MPLTPRQLQTLLWTGVAALLVWAMLALGPVLAPFAAAAILAYVLEPTVRWGTRRRLPRALSVTATMLLALLLFLAVLLIVVPIVQKESVQLRTQLPALIATLTGKLVPWLRETLGVELDLNPASLRAWLAENLSASGDELAATAYNWLKSGSSAALQVLGLVFLVPVVAFYLLLDWDELIARGRELVPPRWAPQVTGFLAETDGLLGQYLRGQALVMLAAAGYYALALLIARFELWLPIGVLTGLLIAIPYLGFATGLLFALVAAMLQFGPLKGALLVAVVYGVGQVVESVVLTPRLVGERIGLHPLAVILALLVFGSLFGFVGVLLALPLAAVLAVALRHLRTAWLQSPVFGRPAP
ncbi:MAG TPA: AI-2E family transporter [Burkholderiaceae bacterium]|nr:AI-2E family transporter [Burkholderiaceae bacterium]